MTSKIEATAQKAPGTVEGLSAVKRELLSEILAGKVALGKDSATGILHDPDVTRAALTPAQEGFWLIDKLRPGSPICNLSEAFWIDGPISVEALNSALQTMVDRHSILACHISIDAAHGRMEMVREESPLVSTEFYDITGASRHDAERRANGFAATPIPLDKAPLARTGLYRLSETSHLLVLVLHHIIGDGWSFGVFMNELLIAYRAHVDGKRAELAPLPFQYLDYAQSVFAERDQTVYERKMAEASVSLKGVPPLSTFPADHVRPPVIPIDGAIYSFSLPALAAENLSRTAKALNVSKFQILFAAFQILLFRYSGQNDLVVAFPDANRNRPGTHGSMGLYIDILLARCTIDGDVPFSALVDHVADAVVEARKRQGLDFKDIVRAAGWSGDLSRHPLFQVMFVYQNWPLPEIDFAGSSAKRCRVHSGTSKYDLSIILEDQNSGTIEGCIEYNSALYDETFIANLAQAYRVLVLRALDQPHDKVDDLPLLPAGHGLDDAEAIVANTGDGLLPQPLEAMVDARASETPDKVAVKTALKEMSYAELVARAEQFANHIANLHTDGTKPVGVMMKRSEEAICAILASQKAGLAYLPIDQNWPADRIQSVMVDSDVETLILDDGLDDPTATWDTLWKGVVVRPSQVKDTQSAVPRLGDPDGKAYIIYTSGSTGIPKGIVVSRRSLAQYAVSSAQALQLSARDRILAVTSFGFDPSIQDVLVGLTCGATIRLASEDELKTVRPLQALLDSGECNLLQATPSLYRTLLEQGFAGHQDLRLFIGAEPFGIELSNKLLKRSKSLVNLYGLTEGTVWQSATPILPDRPATIEKAIPGYRLRVLDRKFQELPVGAVGEIFICGSTLAEGYHSQPDLTAARFVPDPFRCSLGSRMLRTGDLGREKPDGTIQYLGRRDFQVKIRGHRIELGDIEANLRELDLVNQTVVCVKQLAKHAVLVAYVVAAQESVSAASIIEAVGKKLPHYMIPNHIVFIEQLPKNANGKLDRIAIDALPLEVGRRSGEAPNTPTQKQVAEAWSQALGHEDFGIDDGLFDVGGSSLGAAVIMDLLLKSGVRPFSIEDIFSYPTICQFSAFLDGKPNVRESQNVKARHRAQERRNAKSRRGRHA